jgi:hypothetical protein
MKIEAYRSSIPAQSVRNVEERLSPAESSAPVARIAATPDGKPLYRVPFHGATPEALGVLSGPQIGLARILTKIVADHLGTAGRIANGVLWLAVDAKRLHDRFGDQTVSAAERFSDVIRVAGSLADVTGAIPGLEAVHLADTPIHFLADVGESVCQGQVTLNSMDLLTYAGGDAATAGELTKALVAFTLDA